MDFLFDNRKKIRTYEELVSEILKNKRGIVSLSDEQLKEKTEEFRQRLNEGETLDDILPEAFAVAREASRRFLGKEQREVQLLGAIALHNGDVAEMKTGEGKTLTAPIAAYLNALTGQSVHIATSNDYLASRDADELRPMFEGLGLTVGMVAEERLPDSKEDLERRKKAYSCDITYGSSNAFAFDYLRDNTAKNKEQVVRSKEEPGFIIIDEADQILVNDAVMPFKLSGTVTDPRTTEIEKFIREIEIKNQEKELARLNSNANAFVNYLFNDKKHCGRFKTVEVMKLHQGGDKELTSESQRKYSVLYCDSNDASLTERGWLEAFRYFRGVEINKYINSHKKQITDNPTFELDKDYSISGEDGIVLTLSGLEKAVRNIPKMRSLNNTFYSSSEFSGLDRAIENALKAYFVLEKGREYVLEDTIENGVVKKKVMLISNGRTADGRVYSGGLQQAIELKEKKLNSGIQIATTKEHEELASVSQKAFYSIYPKVSGMTGTSAQELFENVYGMDTVRIPKHVEYDVDYSEIDAIYKGREDKGTVLFETDSEKLNAVVDSVLESQKKGQPVLIATLSVKASNLLYEAFQKRGIPCEKLNAENAALEGEIISRAGRKGAVTISTQMAGRGTDIKLGGELKDAIQREKDATIARLAKKMFGDNPTEAQLRQTTKFIEDKKMDVVIESATRLLEKEKQELVEAGGLKVIGYGHFATKRDDEQLRGRAARQDDPGITEFYTSVNDLRTNLTVPKYVIDSLHKKGLKQGSPMSGIAVDKIVANAQSRQEGILTTAIESTQKVDYNLAIMRKKIYDQRTRMLFGEDTKDNMEYIIDTSVVNLVGRNLPKNVYMDYRKKIKNSELNINNFIIDVEETFGIDLSSQFEEGKFKTLGDIERYLSKNAKKQYRETRSKNGDGKQEELDRVNIVATIDDAWLTFNENLEYIRFQNSLNNIVENKDFDEIYAMRRGFNESMSDAKLRMLGKMFGKTSTKTRQVEVQEEEIYHDEELNDYYVTEKKPYTNLSVRPAKIMASLGEKFKLIKNKIKHEFELVTVDTHDDMDRVQNIDFDSSHEKSDNPVKK